MLFLLVGVWSIVLSSDFISHGVTWWAGSVLRVWGLLWIMIRCQMVFVRLAFFFSSGSGEETALYNIITLSQQTNRHGNKSEQQQIAQMICSFIPPCFVFFFLPLCAIPWISASWVKSFQTNKYWTSRSKQIAFFKFTSSIQHCSNSKHPRF